MLHPVFFLLFLCTRSNSGKKIQPVLFATINEYLVSLRTLFFKTPYGDQGLIIHRETYFKNNGYSKIPLMEDLELSACIIPNTNVTNADTELNDGYEANNNSNQIGSGVIAPTQNRPLIQFLFE